MRTFYRDRSEIHGWGCFVSGHLSAETTHLCPAYRNDNDDENPRAVWFDDEVWHLYNPFCFLNHSDEPNAELYLDGGSVYLRLTRPINAGEEVTIDYGPDWADSECDSEGSGCLRAADREIPFYEADPRCWDGSAPWMG